MRDLTDQVTCGFCEYDFVALFTCGEVGLLFNFNFTKGKLDVVQDVLNMISMESKICI